MFLVVILKRKRKQIQNSLDLAFSKTNYEIYFMFDSSVVNIYSVI